MRAMMAFSCAGVRFGDAAGGLAHAFHLQRPPQHEAFLRDPEGDAADPGAGVRIDVDEILLREPLQGFAHRRTRDLEAGGDVLFLDGRSGLQLQPDDGPAQKLIYLVRLCCWPVRRRLDMIYLVV